MGSDIGTGVSKPVYVMGGGGQGIESLTSTSLVFKTRDYPKATHRILGIFGWVSTFPWDGRCLSSCLRWVLGRYLTPTTRFSLAVGEPHGAMIVVIEQISKHERLRHAMLSGLLKRQRSCRFNGDRDFSARKLQL